MENCYTCKAKTVCSAAVQPGSIMCMMYRMRLGGTHADEEPYRQPGRFCQYCGKPLREIGTERFCDNPSCVNRYQDV